MTPTPGVAETIAELIDRSGNTVRGVFSVTNGLWSVAEGSQERREIRVQDIRSLRFQRVEITAATALAEEEPGMEALYYPQPDFVGIPVRRSVHGIQHAATDQVKVGQEVPLSVRWVAQWVPVTTGVHQFSMRSSQTARLWIEGQCVASIQSTNQLRESAGKIHLVADQRCAFIVEVPGTATQPPPTLQWEAPGIASTAVTPTRFLMLGKKDPIADITRGLLATYYGNTTFSNPRLIRVDPAVAMDWKQRAPFPEMGVGTRFSVMWEGTVTVPTTGNLRIGMEAEGGIRVSLDDSIVIQRWEDFVQSPASSATFPMRVEAGHPHPMKVEFFNQVGAARVLVNWFPSAGTEAPVMANGLLPATPPDASYPVPPQDPKNLTTRTSGAWIHPGLVLSDGSFVAQPMESGTRSQLKLSPGDLPASTPVEWVSRVYLVEMGKNVVEKLDSGRSGALLHDGDFVEGDFQSLDAAELRMSSILFGAQRIKRERVAAIVLRSLPRSLSPWRVETLTGSILRPSGIEFQADGLRLSGLPCGPLRLPEMQLMEINRSIP